MKVNIKRSVLLSKKGKIDIKDNVKEIRMNETQLDKIAKIVLEMNSHSEVNQHGKSNSN
ncbi:MAG: hypothetical protein IJR67_00020 [Acholeplasmatales bacterium]|nr:hypothetical protein [Acholeplasmatales bacterium]